MRLVAMDTKHLVPMLESDIAVAMTRRNEDVDPFLDRIIMYGKMLHAKDQVHIGTIIEKALEDRGHLGIAGRDPEWKHTASSFLQMGEKRKFG